MKAGISETSFKKGGGGFGGKEKTFASNQFGANDVLEKAPPEDAKQRKEISICRVEHASRKL